MSRKRETKAAVSRSTRKRKARNTALRPVICLVSLGCAKNAVDSERILGKLVSAGFIISEEPRDAEICLVNTCGFIADARQETSDVLKELVALRENGTIRAVIALGCMVELASKVKNQAGFLAGADDFVPFHDYDKIETICRKWIPATEDPGRSVVPFREAPRLRLGAIHIAGLKIAEGCSNRCHYCNIPIIRGPQKSRPLEEIMHEANDLISAGARELDIIAQDTTAYGLDLYGERSLPRLLRNLAELDFDGWMRLLYAHPASLSDDIIDILSTDPRFCPYLDMPLQHISDPVLRAMGRSPGRSALRGILDHITDRMPGLTLRTTFIVGYPGETDRHFEELAQFVGEGRFQHMGVFTYSAEPETQAARLTDTVPEEVKIQRRDRLMEIQRDVSNRHMKAQIGKVATVMLDGMVDRDTWQARTSGQAPEVDGVVFVEELQVNAQPGDFLQVRITGGLDYDSIAEPV